MKLYETINQSGEIYAATYMEPLNGWSVCRNNADHVYIPYKKIFKFSGGEYFVSDTHNAVRIGKMMIDRNIEAEAEFEKNHPELNP